MVVIWTENAKKDLQNYKQNSNIITDNKVENYITSLIKYVDSLSNFNKLGKFLFNRHGFEIRQLLYNFHRIFYAIGKDKIFILSISHTSRNMSNAIKEIKENI